MKLGSVATISIIVGNRVRVRRRPERIEKVRVVNSIDAVVRSIQYTIGQIGVGENDGSTKRTSRQFFIEPYTCINLPNVLAFPL